MVIVKWHVTRHEGKHPSKWGSALEHQAHENILDMVHLNDIEEFVASIVKVV